MAERMAMNNLASYKEHGFKPVNLWRPEQVAHCEEILTSAILYLELMRHDLDRLKRKLARDLDGIRQMKETTTKGGDGG
jgi:hypothetical protein